VCHVVLTHRQQQDEQIWESVTNKGHVTCTEFFFLVGGEALRPLLALRDSCSVHPVHQTPDVR
jgi:hypothetical protein